MILLDTHVLVWLASDPRHLSDAAASLIRENQHAAHISAASAWEISILAKRRRLVLPLPAEEFVDRAIRRHRLIELPITRQVAQQSALLPDLHADPFDRILVAECLSRGLTLVSRDGQLARYPGVSVVW